MTTRPVVAAQVVDPWANVEAEPRQTTLSEWEHRLDENGYEVVDPTPEEPPIGWFAQPTMVEHIRNMVQSELLARQALEEGYETFEEAEDFEVGDDYDPSSPYEESFDPAPVAERPPESAAPSGAPEPAPPGSPPAAASSGPGPGSNPPPAGTPPGATG